MIIYKDIISNDELFSDTYPMTLIDDVIFRVVGKTVTESAGDFDAAIGANPSAEEASEGVDESSVSGCNVVLANRLVETAFDKKGYMVYIKDYMKKIKERLTKENPDRAKIFQDNIQGQVKKIVGEFKEYQFFLGESMNADGMVVLMKWEEIDGNEAPCLYFFKDGLLEEKVWTKLDT